MGATIARLNRATMAAFLKASQPLVSRVKAECHSLNDVQDTSDGGRPSLRSPETSSNFSNGDTRHALRHIGQLFGS
jgi:hypothetical protein